MSHTRGSTAEERIVKVAAAQMNSTDSVRDNLQRAEALIVDAARERCRLIVLPENFAFMGARNADKVAVAEEAGSGPIQEFLANTARRHQLWVVAGSVNLRSNEAGRVYGSSLVFDDAGCLAARYDKIHLFDVSLPEKQESYRESAILKPGDDAVIVDTPAGMLGLSICYDLRFPELYRYLVTRGATVLTVPAAFTETTGRAHWQSLLRARAIENLSYVIAAGQCGTHADRRKTYGHSMVVSPWGDILATRAEGEGIAVAEVDKELVSRTRESFPALAHRKNSGKWIIGSE